MELSEYTKSIIISFMNSFKLFIPGIRHFSEEEYKEMFKQQMIIKQKLAKKKFFVSKIDFYKYCSISSQELKETVGIYPYIGIRKLTNQIENINNNSLLVKELEEKKEKLNNDNYDFPLEELNLGIHGFLNCIESELIDDLVNELYLELITPKFEVIGVTNTQEEDEIKLQLDFDLNQWNEVTYKLFIYLIENYTKRGKVKFLNIYKYLKSINKDVYAFNFTQDKYKEFILKKHQVKLTTFNTANYEYKEKEIPILKGFEQAFRNQNLK